MPCVSRILSQAHEMFMRLCGTLSLRFAHRACIVRTCSNPSSCAKRMSQHSYMLPTCPDLMMHTHQPFNAT